MKIQNRMIGNLLVLLLLGSSSTAWAESILARVDWAHKVELRIPVTGIITRVNVETGQLVKKGRILVQLDQRAFRANLRHWQAEVSAKKSAYEEARRELERYQSLYDRTMLSDHELQLAKNQLAEANAAFIKARAGLTQARVALDNSTLRAPFNAIVLKKTAELGQAVVIGERQSPLLTLASSETRKAIASVNSARASAFTMGDAVEVRAGTAVMPGRIVAMHMPDSAIDRIDIIARFEVGKNQIMPGAEVTIITK